MGPTLLRHRWRLFRRRAGNPFSLLLVVGLVALVHHLAGRAPGLAAGGPGPVLAAGLTVMALLALGLGWQRLFGAREENGLFLVQPVPARALGALWTGELALLLTLPALVLAVAVWRWFGTTTTGRVLAATPLLAVPGLAALGLRGALGLSRWPRPLRRLTVPAGLAAVVGAWRLGAHGPALLWSALAVTVTLLAPPVALRAIGSVYRARFAATPPPPAVRRSRGAALGRWLPLPRPLRALVLADARLVIRGPFLRGRVVLGLLLLAPLTYVIWPIPVAPPRMNALEAAKLVETARMVISTMLLTFVLAGVGFVLGADLNQAELPFLAFKRLAPIHPRQIWIARQLLVLAAALPYTALSIGALWWRDGGPVALSLAPELIVVAIVVPTFTVAYGLGLYGGVDLTVAGGVAAAAVIIALGALAVFQSQPLLLAAYPLTLVRLYQHAMRHLRRMEV